MIAGGLIEPDLLAEFSEQQIETLSIIFTRLNILTTGANRLTDLTQIARYLAYNEDRHKWVNLVFKMSKVDQDSPELRNYMSDLFIKKNFEIFPKTYDIN